MSVNHSAVNNSASAAPKASRFRSLFAQLGASSDHTIDNTNINMQTTQSVGNLNQLGRDMEAVNLNARTAASTPASRHGLRDDLATPNADTPAASNEDEGNVAIPQVPTQPASAHRGRESSPERRIVLDAQADDDVFGGAVLPAGQQRNEHTADAPIAGPVVGTTMSNTTPTPRADRLAESVNPNNAQGLLTPDCLVFVANLAADQPDVELAETVSAAFSVFGYNVAKVRRDKHQHPFALVQFDNVENAQKALAGSRNMVVGGRRIRTEVAQARRSIILYKNGVEPVTIQEVHDVLGSYGHIQEVKPTTHADARLGIPNGSWVTFSFYLDYKDALNTFNHYNGLYFIMDGPNLDAPPAATRNGGFGFQAPATPRSPTDTRSVFVGTLPFDVSEQEIGQLFFPYGNVKLVNIIRKPIAGGQGYNVFSFVEFSTPHEAHAAAHAEVDLRGKRIRVEPKEYSARRYSRMPYGQSPVGRSYRPIQWGSPGRGYPPQHAMPYGFQPIMGNQAPGPAGPYNGGPPWPTPPHTGPQFRRFHPGPSFHGGSPHAHRNLPAPNGPMPPYPGPEAGANQYGPPPQR